MDTIKNVAACESQSEEELVGDSQSQDHQKVEAVEELKKEMHATAEEVKKERHCSNIARRRWSEAKIAKTNWTRQ